MCPRHRGAGKPADEPALDSLRKLDDVDLESLDVDWAFTGEIEAWRMVLDGLESLASAQRHGFIRHVSRDLVPAAEGEQKAKRPPVIERLRAVMYLFGLDSGPDSGLG